MVEITPDPNATLTLVEGGAVENSINQQSQINLDASLPSELQVSPDLASVSPQAVSVDNSIPEIKLEALERDIYSNCLDPYINVTYGISLSMISLSAVKNINTEMDSTSNLGRDQYITFASTGEVFTDRSDIKDYYNIKGLEFTSFGGHYPQNPMIAVIWDGKMKIFEPHGFALREDIEAMRIALGYDPVEPWNFVYRLEIWFSGFDPISGRWEPRIRIPVNGSKNVNSVIYYLTISTIDAKVTSQGTEYDLSFQMYSHKTLRSDALTFRMQTTPAGNTGNSGDDGQPKAAQPTGVKFGGASGGPARFGDFLSNLVSELKRQVKYETKGKLDITYEIFAPQWLLEATFDNSGIVSVAHGSISYNSNSGTAIYSSRDVDILTIMNTVMEHIPLVRELMLQPSDDKFIKPTVTWQTRTNIKYKADYDEEINGYTSYTFQYYLEPVLSFRSRTTYIEKRNSRTEDNNQLARAQAMLDYGMLLRVYNFIFTNLNSEVIDFDFRFKQFYQEPYPGSVGSDSERRQTQKSTNTDFDKERADLQKTETESQQPAQSSIIFSATSSQSIEQVLGISAPPQGATTNLSHGAKHGGIYRGPDLPASNNAEPGAAQPDMALFHRAKDIYFRYDMLSAEMLVRFDPLWLMNVYMIGGDFTRKLTGDENSPQGVNLFVHTDRVIFIKALKPSQSDFMSSLRNSGSSETTPFIGGFYQVLKVINQFDGGRFVQRLSLFKYPHLNGFTGSI